jgi:hypothetical protein
MDVAVVVINRNASKIDGVKVSLLDRDREIAMRRRLAPGVRMYTGDDFNYAELIAGDNEGYSDALLGIFDPIAPAVGGALASLSRNRRPGVSIATAVRRAVAETGNAVLLGGLVLAVGFATVTASSVPSLAGFGVLACAAVAAATVAELLFLPALVVQTDRLVRTWRPAFRDGIFGAAGLAWPAFERRNCRSPVTP